MQKQIFKNTIQTCCYLYHKWNVVRAKLIYDYKVIDNSMNNVN